MLQKALQRFQGRASGLDLYACSIHIAAVLWVMSKNVFGKGFPQLKFFVTTSIDIHPSGF